MMRVQRVSRSLLTLTTRRSRSLATSAGFSPTSPTPSPSTSSSTSPLPAAADAFVASRLVPRSLLKSLIDISYQPNFDFLTGDLVLVHGFAGAQLQDTHAKTLVWPPQDIFTTLSRIALQWPGLSVPIAEASETDLVDDQDAAEMEAQTESDETRLGRLGLPLDFPFADAEGTTDEEIESRYSRLRMQRAGFAHVFPPYEISTKLRAALLARQEATKGLEPSKRFRLHEFDYDFRVDNVFSARRLRKVLNEIAEKSAGSEINIIAHSMGGQVVLSALSPLLTPKPPPIRSILFAGSPFQQVPTILFAFLHPHPFLPLTPLDSLSWRSGYGFLPVTPGGALVSGSFGSRQQLDLDLQDPDVWIRTNLANPLVRALGGDVKRAHEWLSKALGTAKLFRTLLEATRRKQQTHPSALPKMTTLFSRSLRTPTRVLVKTQGNASDPNELVITHVVRPAMFAPGDGIVPLEALRLSEGWDYELVPSLGHHGALMNDLQGVEMGLRRNLGVEL